MNKITQRSLRDLNSTLPEGAERYLGSAVRKALNTYRKGREPSASLSREQALPILAQRLGRGLKRFLVNDIRSALSSQSQKMA